MNLTASLRLTAVSFLAFSLYSEASQATDAKTQKAAQPQAVAQPSAISLGTDTGIELGGQISDYRYQEHFLGHGFMHESGAKVGLTATGTEALDQGFFVSGDARVAYSSNTYTGTGTMSGLDDYLFDIRALGGKDFLFQNVNWTGQNVTFDVTPYVGLGYRNLYNDFRGTTSTGVHGYRRDSQYLYVPVGVTPRFRVTDDARISTNIEFDELIQGWQASYGGDVIPGAPTINNHQHGGYGLRGSVMYEEASWSAGPFFNYWNINMSDAVVVSGVSLYEPHNQTTEFGLQARYRF